MPTTLLDGASATPTEIGRVRLKFPFLGYPSSDKYTRILDRSYEVTPNDYAPALADRTSYTNSTTYSEQFDNAAWSKSDSTVTADQLANPKDGAVTMDKLLETATSATHFIYTGKTYTAVRHVISIFAKPNGRDWILLTANDGASGYSAFFNVATGALGTTSGGTVLSYITAAGDGVYRCEMSFVPAAGTGTHNFYISTDGATTSYAGDVTKGLYLWGAQVELASRAGPYIATTSVARTASAPPVDILANPSAASADIFAYQVSESDTSPNSNLTTLQFSKTYARIPGDQVRYSSRNFTKPVISNEASATISVRNYSAYATEIATASRNDSGFFTTDNRIFAPFIVTTAAAPTPGIASGGTFTLTYKTSTTGAIAYNAANATIAAALNGLADVITDGLTFAANTQLTTASLGCLLLSLSGGTTTTAVTMNPASMTVSTSKKAFTQVVTNASQKISLARHVTAMAHGFDTAQSLLLVDSNSIAWVLPTAHWGAADANTLQVDSNSTLATADNYGTTNYAADYLRAYTSGVTQVRSKITERYYLPGVTTGITTAADIPVSVPDISDQDIVVALLSSSGWNAVEFTGPEQWMGPIYRTLTTEINLDDL